MILAKITAEDGSVIELAEDNEQGNFLTSVDIQFNTPDSNVKQKPKAMLAKITITGKIETNKNDLKPLYKALFDWSKSLDKNQGYRTVDIEIKEDDTNDDSFRKYHFEKMFVVDYREFYSGNNEENLFELELLQYENNFKTIETY